jgi:ElaB/YqjD/DUF883 family membrane-anchored ribosome-binding protein
MQTQNYGTDSMLDDSAGAAPRAKLDQAATVAHDTVDRVHRKASEVTDRVSTEGERMYAQACDWIAAHPMQAVACALAAGYLFGRIRS